ncbi:hypothetical protein RJ641_002547 [Dillenia turbinata]|uniref:Uncharacterized protein n=1 Tax=Dillenia turbinata TaxID=194707 RepID=A0AAN8VFI2_9MAGN
MGMLLMFDPFAKIVYDFLDGIEDIAKAKVRTVIPADVSFMDDCGKDPSFLHLVQFFFAAISLYTDCAARILRAIRIAARRFRFTRETAHFVKEFSGSVLRLDRVWKMMDLIPVFLSHTL